MIVEPSGHDEHDTLLEAHLEQSVSELKKVERETGKMESCERRGRDWVPDEVLGVD